MEVTYESWSGETVMAGSGRGSRVHPTDVVKGLTGGVEVETAGRGT